MSLQRNTSLNSRYSYLALLAFTFFMLLISSAYGGGVVQNQSPWTLKHTVGNPSPNDNCRSCCYFWNWSNGSPRGRMTSCTQRNLPKRQTTSGDIDGFCYADRDYYFSGRWVKRGQWTRISDPQTVRCVSYRGVPHCCVGGDPQSAGCCWGVAPGPNGIVCWVVGCMRDGWNDHHFISDNSKHDFKRADRLYDACMTWEKYSFRMLSQQTL